MRTRPPVLEPVDPVHGSPLPDEDREQPRVYESELLPVGARRVPGEDGEHGEDPHHQEDERAVATVLAAVELVELSSVEPADPDQPEDDGEVEHADHETSSASVCATWPMSTT